MKQDNTAFCKFPSQSNSVQAINPVMVLSLGKGVSHCGATNI